MDSLFILVCTISNAVFIDTDTPAYKLRGISWLGNGDGLWFEKAAANGTCLIALYRHVLFTAHTACYMYATMVRFYMMDVLLLIKCTDQDHGANRRQRRQAHV